MSFQPLAQPELIRVYRVDSGRNSSLNNRNGGSLVGILDFLEFCEDRLLDTGDYISAFEVSVERGYDEYVEFASGKSRVSGREISPYVGRIIKSENNLWYSFPAAGFWRLIQKRGSHRIEDIYAYLQQQAPPFHQRTLGDTARYVEEYINGQR